MGSSFVGQVVGRVFRLLDVRFWFKSMGCLISLRFDKLWIPASRGRMSMELKIGATKDCFLGPREMGFGQWVSRARWVALCVDSCRQA